MADNEQVTDLTLALLYLTSWEEKAGTLGSAVRSWRSYDWDALDVLRDEGLIYGNRKAKSVYLTDKGVAQAKKILGSSTLAPGKKQEAASVKSKRGGNNTLSAQAFRFRVELDFVELECWREIIVPARFTFYEFHLAIQAIFNWFNYHLYDFTLTSNSETIKITSIGAEAIESIFAGFFPREPHEEVEASELILDDVFPRTRTALYSYDYGDGWEHKIKLLETIKDYDGDAPVCTQGCGDAPPEDVGGEGGFIDFLEAIADKNNPEHEEMVEWGEDQEFARFDLEKINKRLSRWC